MPLARTVTGLTWLLPGQIPTTDSPRWSAMVRDRFARGWPFAVVATVGQLTAGWPPGPSSPGWFWLSTAVLVLSGIILLLPQRFLRAPWLVWALVYLVSVTFVMLATGGVNSGLGSLLLVAVVAVALYGRPWESAALTVALSGPLVAVSATSTYLPTATPRRVLLFVWLASMISVTVHALRHRLRVSMVQVHGLLREAETIDTAALTLSSLLDPGAIRSLATRLAAQIANPPGDSPRIARYLVIEGEYALIEADGDEASGEIGTRWPLVDHPQLRTVIEEHAPLAEGSKSSSESPDIRPTLRRTLKDTSTTHWAWVPVCPEGSLDGVLSICSQGDPLPAESFERCVALSHMMELALSNCIAHRRLQDQATAEERRRIARELHDGLAHELAYIASRAPRSTAAPGLTGLELRDLANAADRALDEARRAITVLSSSRPQSLTTALAQTAEDMGTRFKIPVSLDLADEVEVPGEVTEHLLRIAREAITNAANHADPTLIKVGLRNSDLVRLVIEDDGCGFDPASQDPAGQGFGLISMRERAESIGAEFRLESASGCGTRIEVKLR